MFKIIIKVNKDNKKINIKNYFILVISRKKEIFINQN